MSELSQYQKMTTVPVHRLVLTLGLPTTISMLVTNVYNLTDTYFVSTLGNSASGATGVVFALMAILQAFGFMLGHGAGSNISRLLGAQHTEEAKRYASTSFFLSLGIGLIILLSGLVLLDPLMRLLGATDTILPYARTYGRFILLAAPAFLSSCVMNNILRYEGRATLAMIGLTLGSVLNIIGDAVLIFGFHMGIEGAGISTMVSQYISAVTLFCLFGGSRTQSRFALRWIARRASVYREIFFVGLPSLARQGLSSVSVMVLNLACHPYGDAAIAAMSIVSRVCMFLFCIGLGIGQGYQPVCGFNYGAKLYSRVKSGLFFTLAAGTAFLGVLAAGSFVFAHPIIALFRNDPQVLAVGVPALRAQCVALVLMPVSLCGNMLFQSIGKSGRATLLAVLRSGLCFIPLLLLFSRIWGIDGIELAQPAADALSTFLTLPFLFSFLRHLPPDAPQGIQEGRT